MVSYSVRGAVAIVTIDRPQVRNAVEPTREALVRAFRPFEGEPAQSVAVLTGLPQTCLRNDRRSAIEQWELGWQAANRRFAGGAGRHGAAVAP